MGSSGGGYSSLSRISSVEQKEKYPCLRIKIHSCTYIRLGINCRTRDLHSSPNVINLEQVIYTTLTHDLSSFFLERSTHDLSTAAIISFLNQWTDQSCFTRISRLHICFVEEPVHARTSNVTSNALLIPPYILAGWPQIAHLSCVKKIETKCVNGDQSILVSSLRNFVIIIKLSKAHPSVRSWRRRLSVRVCEEPAQRVRGDRGGVPLLRRLRRRWGRAGDLRDRVRQGPARRQRLRRFRRTSRRRPTVAQLAIGAIFFGAGDGGRAPESGGVGHLGGGACFLVNYVGLVHLDLLSCRPPLAFIPLFSLLILSSLLFHSFSV